MTASNLHGRHAIVTGGGGGIGAVLAGALARQGAALTIMGRDTAKLAAVASLLKSAHGAEARTIDCDVSNAGSVERAFRAAGEAYILINNAGQAEGAEFSETTRALWDRLIAVNLTGTYLCTQQALPGMLRAGAGRVVNIASTAGLKGYARVSAYCASKHGVIGFTRALAVELARTGVTVNAVCPGYTEGAMTEHTLDVLAQRSGGTRADARKKLEKLMPIGRLIRPDEVAAAVLWLCSPEAAAVTGQAIAVDGGETQ